MQVLCTASNDEPEWLTILLRKKLDQVIDQEHQAGLSLQHRECLAPIHEQIRADLAVYDTRPQRRWQERSNPDTCIYIRGGLLAGPAYLL